MNTLTNRKLMQYILLKKSTGTSVILSIFMLPFALIYTRGIFGWLISICILMLTIIPTSMIAVLFGARYFYEPEFIVGYIVASILYFLFTITDASRVNEKILHELRYSACIEKVAGES